MTNDEDKLIKEYGIIREHKVVYTYKGYKYDNPKDAINYAKYDKSRKD